MTSSLPRLLREAAREAEDRIDRKIAEVLAGIPDNRREPERAIDDVREPSVNAELRRLLRELDEHRASVRSPHIPCLAEALDPVRTLATDVASGFLAV